MCIKFSVLKKKSTIAIIGLGYVGLPLAVAFASKYQVIGFDINTKRVAQLQKGNDTTLEVSSKELINALDDSSVQIGRAHV